MRPSAVVQRVPEAVRLLLEALLSQAAQRKAQLGCRRMRVRKPVRVGRSLVPESSHSRPAQ